MWGSNNDSWHVGTEFSRQISSRIYLAVSLFKKLNIQCLNSLTYLFMKRFASLLLTLLYFWVQNIEFSEELFLFFSTLQNRYKIMFTIICFFNVYCIYIINYCFYYIILLIIIGNPQSHEYTRMKIKTLMKWKDDYYRSWWRRRCRAVLKYILEYELDRIKSS